MRGYHRMMQAAGVTESEQLLGLVVSRGPVKAAGLNQLLLLGTSDLASEHELFDSVVVCGGNVRVGGNVGKSLIVARGDITVKGTAQSSTLVAGGTVTIDKPSGAVRRFDPDPANQKDYDKEWHAAKVVTEEKVRKPLGYITFFELSTVGVEGTAAGGAVRVTAVAEGGEFDAVGVKVGDMVTAVEGKKPDTAESLRRLLRDALAVGDATVTLRRGDKDLTVKVSLPE